MELANEFRLITKDYENRLFEVFKETIDLTKNYALEHKMDPVDTYVCVNKAIEDAYKKLAFAQGMIGYCDLPYEAHPNLSDELTERIYAYIEPITNEARKALQKQVDNIVDSSTLGELLEKLDIFKKMLVDKGIDSILYEDLEIKKRVK
jgi:hypothetical protein